MLRVCYALTPLGAVSVYFFGWRCIALIAAVCGSAVLTEALFVRPTGRPVTSAVFVTGLILALSLPPTLPLWMGVVGAVAGVAAGKMVFGGFGRNVFNPAMVGRCFLYVTFPVAMTATWTLPVPGTVGGFASWRPALDAMTRATPLVTLKAGGTVSMADLVLGRTAGSLGETSALLILLGAAYVLYKKAAPWRLALACLLGATGATAVLYLAGVPKPVGPVAMLTSGSFLFGAAYVVTEPVSGPKTRPGQWIYGGMIGALTIVLRTWSNFAEGLMFAVLLMNAFVPILDRGVRALKPRGGGAA